ncbi:MAG: hypothetical protein QOE72_3372 [Chloroflexota bacterium]|jgi:hypothetical protein|nr:hypothetical protein [Chloroflexota bacterium]
MFAVVVRTELAEGAATEQARQTLETQVIPMFKRSPGFHGGYWLAPTDGHDGLSLLIYNDEQSARAVAATMHSRPLAKLVSVEVREVVASA